MVVQKNTLYSAGGILSRPVVKLTGRNNFLTWAEIVHGIGILGSAGSGKTSFATAHLMTQILEDPSQPGMEILCVKSSERDRAERIVKQAGREDDLVILSAESDFTIGALEYELYRKGPHVTEYKSALNLIMEIFIMGENQKPGGGSGKSTDDQYWITSMELRLTRLMMLLVLSGETVSFKNMRQLMVDSFNEDEVQHYIQLHEDVESEDEHIADQAADQFKAWVDNNYFIYCFEVMRGREDLSGEQAGHAQLVSDYFLKEYPDISSKTRAIVNSSITGLLEPFTTGVLASHFDGQMSEELMPERIYKEGAIIIVDVPILEEGLSAVYATGIMKKLFQLCMQRRRPDLESNPRPSVLWVDEAHLVLTPNDEKFVTVCRETLTGCVFLTQTINNILIAMGASLGREKAMALLTNLGTQFFCRNICPDTNAYAANMIGKEYVKTQTSSMDTNDRGSYGTNETKDYIIAPEDFKTLKTGGSQNAFKVETILICGGKEFSTGERFLECVFDQRGRQPHMLKRIFSSVKSLFV